MVCRVGMLSEVMISGSAFTHNYLRESLSEDRVLKILQTLNSGGIPTLLPVPEQRIYILSLPSRSNTGRLGYVAILHGNQLTEFHENSSSGLLYFVNSYQRAIERMPEAKVFVLSELRSAQEGIRKLFRRSPHLLKDYERRSTELISWLDFATILPFEVSYANLSKHLRNSYPSDIELYEMLVSGEDYENSLSIVRRLVVRKMRIVDQMLNHMILC